MLSLVVESFCLVNMIKTNINKFISAVNKHFHTVNNFAYPPVQPDCEHCQTTCYLQLKNTPVS